ncbi:MAG: hypothetical protein PWP31_1924 [Clostridia bacterium]|nr:hypothetical protein [Clostridia bacterium]
MGNFLDSFCGSDYIAFFLFLILILLIAGVGYGGYSK